MNCAAQWSVLVYDDKGDLDRESFFVKVNGGKAEVATTLKPKW